MERSHAAPYACKSITIVNSASAAVKLLDELWEMSRPYIFGRASNPI
jgi:hypothetical protein